MSLRDAQVVVVGGTSGMGLEIARAASAQGAHVRAVGKTAERVKTAKAALGDAVNVQALDMADEAAVRAYFSGLDAIDHLVIPATGGNHRFGRVAETPMSEIRSLFENRFWGTYNIVHHAAPLMRPSGSVTLFSGTAAVRGWAGASILSAALAAVEALARALALELAPIRVNVVRPGAVDTPLLRAVVPPDFEAYSKTAGAALPARRIGATSDIAHAA